MLIYLWSFVGLVLHCFNGSHSAFCVTWTVLTFLMNYCSCFLSPSLFWTLLQSLLLLPRCALSLTLTLLTFIYRTADVCISKTVHMRWNTTSSSWSEMGYWEAYPCIQLPFQPKDRDSISGSWFESLNKLQAKKFWCVVVNLWRVECQYLYFPWFTNSNFILYLGHSRIGGHFLSHPLNFMHKILQCTLFLGQNWFKNI